VNLSYNAASRRYQDRYDTRRLADRIDERLVSDVIDDDDRAFIERRDMLFLATADAQGRPQCSYKGGAPGFVRVLDEHTIAFPNYDGNGMFLSAGNALENPHVGVLFIDFEERKRLRLNGVAEHLAEHPLLAEWPEAQFLWCIRATEVFPNCPRYIHRYRLEERSRFVPRAECRTPVPAWKRREWANDALAADDPAYARDAEIFEN
jgi:predicted pyridoxine 5'-phosphate oxidase superfamily flavin-nucleotide-binding protein